MAAKDKTAKPAGDLAQCANKPKPMTWWQRAARIEKLLEGLNPQQKVTLLNSIRDQVYMSSIPTGSEQSRAVVAGTAEQPASFNPVGGS